MTTLTLVARGQGVHPTVAGMAMARRDGILSIPLEGLPPVPVGLIWSKAHENARIRALTQVARSISRARSAPRLLAANSAPAGGRIQYAAPIGVGAFIHDGQLLLRIVPDGTSGPAASGSTVTIKK